MLLHDSGVLTGEHGAEIFVIVSKEPLSGSKEELSEPEVWIGRTVYAQDIESYSKRDMEKPARDTTVGLLPPKLAQILLNFGHWMVQGYGLRVTGYGKTNQKPETRNQKLTVLDPFCGTGVIPMEALLRKWNVVASDLSLKAANACERNCDWIRKEEKILKRDVESVILKHDATKPFPLEKLPKNLRPDLIVTETTLGPPLASRPTIKDAQKLKTENEKIQAAFLRSAAEVFPRVPIVCTWPVWYHSKGQIHLEKIWETLHEIGYRATLPPGHRIRRERPVIACLPEAGSVRRQGDSSAATEEIGKRRHERNKGQKGGVSYFPHENCSPVRRRLWPVPTQCDTAATAGLVSSSLANRFPQ